MWQIDMDTDPQPKSTQDQSALRGLVMAWLTQNSFDDCESNHGQGGFLSTAEFTTALEAFVASGA